MLLVNTLTVKKLFNQSTYTISHKGSYLVEQTKREN